MNCSYAIRTQSRQLLWLLIVFVFAVSGKNVALAQQRYQAMSLSFLTELPERDGTRVQVASQQKPNKDELKVSSDARITPPFAHNRSDQYLSYLSAKKSPILRFHTFLVISATVVRQEC